MSALTPWEAGQCLISSADQLSEDEKELRQAGFKELADMLHECRLKIGDHFNKLGTHDFGLPAHPDGRPSGLKKCEPCGGSGPVLWDPKTGQYACKKCHSQPSDPFFTEAERRMR